MSATYQQARDAMFTLFYLAWTSNAPAIVGSVPEIRWQGKEVAAKPPVDNYWCRVSASNVGEPQGSLQSSVASPGNRRYNAQGILVIELFCPMSVSDSHVKGEDLAVVARDAFKGKETSNGVWFRNATIKARPASEDAYRFNIVVEYEYDDIG